MATIGTKYIEVLNDSEFLVGQIVEYPEENGESFEKKAPVHLDSTSGEVEIATESGDLIGLSLTAAAGVDDTMIPVLLLSYDSRLSITCTSAGTRAATTQAMVGESYGYILSVETNETAKTTLDTADEGNQVFTVVALDPRDEVGDVGGRLIVKVKEGKLNAQAS